MNEERIFEVKFDNYLRYKPLLKIEGSNVSGSKTTYNGAQIRISDKNHPLYFEFRDEIRTFVDEVLAKNNSKLRVVQNLSSWMVKYNKNGHQIPHKHGGTSGYDILSAVLCFNNTDKPIFFAECNGVEYKSCDYPGLLRIFNSSQISHCTGLAVKPRAVIVQDFLVTESQENET
jgi:hypothetical protein